MTSSMDLIKKFEDDDTGYLNWVHDNPTGYVINCKDPPRHYIHLHRATCRTITGQPANGESWAKDYIKVCSLDKQELVSWTKTQARRQPDFYKLCNP
jgi:hypothetical protein